MVGRRPAHDGTAATATFGELTLTLGKGERVGEGFRVEVRADVAGREAEILFGTYGPPYGFHVAGPGGKRTACTVERVTRDLHLQGNDGPRYTGRNRPTGKLDVALRCESPGPMRDGWSLVYVCPEKIRKAELPFAVRDVPLR